MFVVTRKLTTETFIEKASQIHNNIYDYSEVNYVNSKTKIKILCKLHGCFEQLPSEHLYGKGCYSCSGKKRKTTEQFIKEAKEIHGDLYDYSKVVYSGQKVTVKIICKTHDEFEQKPFDHLQGKGCQCCGKDKSSNSRVMSSEEYFKRILEKYGDTYDYSLMDYKGFNEPITIICKEHGAFSKTAKVFLRTSACPVCGLNSLKESKRLTTESFITRCNSIYGKSLDFTNTKYTSFDGLVEYVCPVHGLRTAKAYALLHDKSGCTACTEYGGYSKDKIGYLYINYIVTKDNNDFIKLGITNNYAGRMRTFLSKNNANIIDCVNLDTFEFDGKYCYNLEYFIKTALKDKIGIITKDYLPDGYTETVSVDNLNLIYKLINLYKGDINCLAHC